MSGGYIIIHGIIVSTRRHMILSNYKSVCQIDFSSLCCPGRRLLKKHTGEIAE